MSHKQRLTQRGYPIDMVNKPIKLLSSKTTKQTSSGFALVELMVVSVIFLLAASFTFTAITFGQNQHLNALRHQDALFLAKIAADNLRVRTTDSCMAANVDDTLYDTYDNDESCIGTGYGPYGACDFDHPRDRDEVTKLFEAPAVDEGGSELEGELLAVLPLPEGMSPDASWVRYLDQNYRIVWNVDCNKPVLGAHQVSVITMWGDMSTAMEDGRFVVVRFVKGLNL